MSVAGHRPLVALSGGVDSAVAAYLLKARGEAVEALHMTNWDDDEDGYCTAREDLQAARSVAQALEIPLHHVSFAAEYRERIFRAFVEEYQQGLTPNPDILCNREVKFGVCLEYAKRLGATTLITGHYARLKTNAQGEPELHRAVDLNKDQTYFLQHMPQAALAHVGFPIGDYRKEEVRAIAKQARLPVFNRKDSTGICFIGERPFKEFLARYVHSAPGPIESVEGVVLGQHDGLSYYTIGQRQGIKVGGLKDQSGLPWYVARKDAARNTLIIANGENHPALLSQEFSVGPIHWLGPPQPIPTAVEVQIRHRGECLPAQLLVSDASLGGHVRVRLTDAPFRYVAPGQYAALYHGEHCLGGAVIVRAKTLAGDIIGGSRGEIHE